MSDLCTKLEIYKKFSNINFANNYWVGSENDLKEPLSKFYRDIYKQITEPHLYKLLTNWKLKVEMWKIELKIKKSLKYVDTDYVKNLYEALISNNSDMAICEVTEVDEKYRTIDDTNSRQRLSNEIKTGLELLDVILPAKTYAYVVAWNKLYKRELFNNLRYAEGKIYEDEFIIHRDYWHDVIKSH